MAIYSKSFKDHWCWGPVFQSLNQVLTQKNFIEISVSVDKIIWPSVSWMLHKIFLISYVKIKHCTWLTFMGFQFQFPQLAHINIYGTLLSQGI